MMRMRFLPGLVLGLLIGLAAGLYAGVFVVPPRNEPGAVPREVQDLTRQLEFAQRDKDSLNRQLDEFRTLAERMTASFTDLERRFKSLEDDMRAREAGAEPSPPPPSSPPAEPSPTPAA